ncbi:putative lipoprotein [Pandoraea pneumonica]|jgi:hypothetical protein|uniref:Putative lipoprotein n=1 Tax=Pandoraea pneumonica TaxID=2508299 RepID=A0A5E4RS80_9BURK|nr:hypothetical protein [Pandoraea pneumonica]VVD66290.1 putative lipoprotein [Pandoraea pneumonica]
MQTRRRLLAASLAVTLTAMLAPAAHAARPAVPIVPHDNMPIVSGSGKPLSLEEIRGAITRGAAGHDWATTQDKPGELVASINVRNKHYASVTIKYTETAYSVSYRDSTNLEYALSGAPAASSRREDFNNTALPANTPMIHPNYNRWVDTLIRDINAELRRL